MADITVDLWQTFDFTTLDTTNLAANDNTAVGTWTVTNPDTTLATSASGEKISTGLINGNSDAGGTRGLSFTPPTPSSDNVTIDYEYDVEKDEVSFGFWYKFPAAFIGSDDEHDILYVENALGENELYVKHTDHGGPAGGGNGDLFLYTGEDEYSSRIVISDRPDEWLWITAKLEVGGLHRLRVFDEDGNQIGSEQTRTAHLSEPYHTAHLGSAVGALQGHSGSLYFDDWVMDWTDATFPLGPPLSEGAQNQLAWIVA